MALMGSKGGTKEWGSSKILRNLPSKKTMLFGYLEYYDMYPYVLCRIPTEYGYSVSVSVSSNDIFVSFFVFSC